MVNLTSTLNDESTVSPLQTVIFNCMIVCHNACGSLQWSSEEYIDSSTTSEMLWDYAPGSCEMADDHMNTNAIATCLSAVDNNGLVTIVSQLNITVLPDHTRATVTCSDNGYDMERMSITFCKN